ncbi:MAG: signal peptide peptidase SppA [Desulfocapsaceae bacterium]|nr:signal peptide peptidase SppA [Desulfocapsaceae bacterium]
MKDLASTILNILKFAGKTITVFRNIVFNILFLGLLLFIIIGLASQRKVSITPQSALLLNMKGDIVEEKQIMDPFSDYLSSSIGFSRLPEETLLQDVLDVINTAAEDKRISSIVLDMSKMGYASFGQMRDIGMALENFKSKGKEVIAAEDFYSQNQYFLASYANRIFLNPAGLVELHGLGAYRLYFQDALKKLKINYHVFRVGKYKSALEPITRNSMSSEAKTQNSLWLSALWQEFVDDVTKRRNISPETVELYTNSIASLLKNTKGDTAKLALDIGLVDELKTRGEVESYLSELTGYSSKGEYNYISFNQYLSNIPRSYIQGQNGDEAVGIIVAQGNIIPGEQPPGTIGSETMLKLLGKAGDDQRIKAVVLRINSGGGSVFASEVIRKEIQELRKKGKPVVVSMGTLAASGGYWIAAETDEIWAYPTTLTGSIGIFGAIPTFEDTLANMGIYSDGTGTTELADGLNITRPLSKEIKDAVQLSIEHGYEKFLDIVAAGRNIDNDALETVADGRVFDGATAKTLGLVDRLGNLDQAIQSAAALADMESTNARYIRSGQNFSELLRDYFYSKINPFLLSDKTEYTSLSRLLSWLESTSKLMFFNDPKGMYAHWMIQYH